MRKVRTISSLLAFLLAQAQSFAQSVPNRESEIQMHNVRAAQALQERNPDLAVHEYEAILALDPSNAEAQGNIGVVAFLQGNCPEARMHFTRALALKPSLWKAQAMLGLCEQSLGDTAEAQAHMKRAFSHLHDVKVQTLVGLSLIEFSYREGNRDQALQVLGELQQNDPTNVDVSYTAYRIYSDLAAQARDRIALLQPDSARMHQILAQHFVNEGNIKAAIEQYREALRIDPRVSGAHFELGEAILQDSLKTDSQEEARKEFESALQQYPNDEKAECWLGALAFLQGRTDDALRLYTHALELNPRDASAQVGIAKVQISLDHQKEALEHLLAAVRIDPSSSNAHFRLSQLYRRMNRTTDADQEEAIFKRLHETEERFGATFYRPRVDSQMLDVQAR